MFRKKFFAMKPDNDNIALFSGMFCRLFERFRLVKKTMPLNVLKALRTFSTFNGIYGFSVNHRAASIPLSLSSKIFSLE